MAPLLTRNNDDSTIDLPKVWLNSLHHLSKDRGTVPCRQTWKRNTITYKPHINNSKKEQINDKAVLVSEKLDVKDSPLMV